MLPGSAGVEERRGRGCGSLESPTRAPSRPPRADRLPLLSSPPAASPLPRLCSCASGVVAGGEILGSAETGLVERTSEGEGGDPAGSGGARAPGSRHWHEPGNSAPWLRARGTHCRPRAGPQLGPCPAPGCQPVRPGQTSCWHRRGFTARAKPEGANAGDGLGCPLPAGNITIVPCLAAAKPATSPVPPSFPLF